MRIKDIFFMEDFKDVRRKHVKIKEDSSRKEVIGHKAHEEDAPPPPRREAEELNWDEGHEVEEVQPGSNGACCNEAEELNWDEGHEVEELQPGSNGACCNDFSPAGCVITSARQIEQAATAAARPQGWRVLWDA
jgi:hypothetical protein